MLPELAKGDANKVFVIPSEFAEAFGGISKAFSGSRNSESSGSSAGSTGSGGALGSGDPPRS
jgi:hypothetical protein